MAKIEEVEARFGCPLIELWGMTELGGLGTTHPVYGPNKHGSIGPALPYTEARVADVNDASRTLPCGEVGELMMRGPLVMQGYYGNDVATNEALEEDRRLHTGDLAETDEDGCAYIAARQKDVIPHAGYNGCPGERWRPGDAHPAAPLVTRAALAPGTADICLRTQGLAPRLLAMNTVRRTMTIIRRTHSWAISYNLAALPLAAAGLVQPWMAALGMSASSLLVVLNALRVSRVSSQPNGQTREAAE